MVVICSKDLIFTKYKQFINKAAPLRLLEQLCSGAIVLAFVHNGDLHAKNYPVSISVVMKEEFVLTCSKKYFALHMRKISTNVHDLKDLDFIDYFLHGPYDSIRVNRVTFFAHYLTLFQFIMFIHTFYLLL